MPRADLAIQAIRGWTVLAATFRRRSRLKVRSPRLQPGETPVISLSSPLSAGDRNLAADVLFPIARLSGLGTWGMLVSPPAEAGGYGSQAGYAGDARRSNLVKEETTCEPMT
jgi:hypothetical protein